MPNELPGNASRGRSVLFEDCFPTHPPANSDRWPEAKLAGASKTVMFPECELATGSACADLPWLWSELATLREWVRQRVPTRAQVDLDAFLLSVASVVIAERPNLGSTPPQEYLRTLAEKLMLAQAG